MNFGLDLEMENAIYFPWLAPFISNDGPGFSLSLDFSETYYLWTLSSHLEASPAPLCLLLFCVSLYTTVTVCLRSVLAGGGPGGSSQSVPGPCRRCSCPEIISSLLNKQERLLFPLHWLSYISPEHRPGVGFVKCRVRLVALSLPRVSQLLLPRHLRLSLGSCGQEVKAGVPAFQQDVRSSRGLRFTVDWLLRH